jgi:hypothetical protein
VVERPIWTSGVVRYGRCRAPGHARRPPVDAAGPARPRAGRRRRRQPAPLDRAARTARRPQPRRAPARRRGRPARPAAPRARCRASPGRSASRRRRSPARGRAREGGGRPDDVDRPRARAHDLAARRGAPCPPPARRSPRRAAASRWRTPASATSSSTTPRPPTSGPTSARAAWPTRAPPGPRRRAPRLHDGVRAARAPGLTPRRWRTSRAHAGVRPLRRNNADDGVVARRACRRSWGADRCPSSRRASARCASRSSVRGLRASTPRTC